MTNRSDAAFDVASTASDVLAGVDLAGKRMIVTGSNSGLGRHTAHALAQAGAEVTLAVRERAAGNIVASEIAKATSRIHPLVGVLDLTDPGSVDEFVGNWSGPVHALINNAGVMATPERRTDHGWEWQFATNHLGHFQLSCGLSDALALGHGRVVSVSSVGHVNGGILFGDINFERTPYDRWAAYSQSKTANVLFAVAAAARWQRRGITVNALNPGRIWETGLARHIGTPPESFDPTGERGVSVKSIAQGSATSVLLAASPLVEGVTGKYFEDCRPAALFSPGVRRGVASHAMDPVAADRLWVVSAALLADAGHPIS